MVNNLKQVVFYTISGIILGIIFPSLQAAYQHVQYNCTMTNLTEKILHLSSMGAVVGLLISLLFNYIERNLSTMSRTSKLFIIIIVFIILFTGVTVIYSIFTAESLCLKP